jgi:hypothetical protein
VAELGEGLGVGLAGDEGADAVGAILEEVAAAAHAEVEDAGTEGQVAEDELALEALWGARMGGGGPHGAGAAGVAVTAGGAAAGVAVAAAVAVAVAVEAAVAAAGAARGALRMQRARYIHGEGGAIFRRLSAGVLWFSKK